ncbi:Gfo/Idh/MocA family protein [Furfurilactobacillus siliginis]|uniref:Oxidoreductase n=1 Tax=Furfurilactobacillus siliginis TaxID=348151 RepID=A0A0R2L7F3_9LACO|nr:Gfo/Idh/MocA family oxidoreductase [Furfurilactobacillus siliginis]KRN95340.1 oxidoreductase [Furfurilactobacillus siliginis]GEK28262.1 oxidoreductase [Furfurilactobacillus siliginis]
MLKLGIIGTNWITQQFVEAAAASQKYELTSVYSRHEDTGKTFAEKNGGQVYTSLETFFKAGDFDVVYIASPNSLHAAQTIQALDAGKEVIVEKPLVSNPTEYAQVKDALAAHPELHVFEAARHIHEPNFRAIRKQLSEMSVINGATLTYMKYSSRFDNYLAGENPNVFTTTFSGGALQDLGVYVVYDAVAWFGKPNRVHYYTTPLRTGADGKGIAVLGYDDFDVTLNIGKNTNSYLPSEIYGLKDTIVMDNAAELKSVIYHASDGSTKRLSTEPAANPMLAEVDDFATVLNDPKNPDNMRHYQTWLHLSEIVNGVLYDLRRKASLVFPADK